MVSSVIVSGVQALGTNFTGSGAMQDANRNYMTYNKFGNSYMKAAMVASGGISGGISSSIAGGKFMDGFRQGVITAGLNHVAHMTVEKWKTVKMNIKYRNQRKSSCVMTSGIMAREALGFPMSEDQATYYEKMAEKDGGYWDIPKNLKKLGLDVSSFDKSTDENANWSFPDGIPEAQKAAAIKFIVESINQGHPVILSFKNSTTEGHAAVVSSITYKEDFSAIKSISLTDPSVKSNTIYSFNGNDMVTGIFSVSMNVVTAAFYFFKF